MRARQHDPAEADAAQRHERRVDRYERLDEIGVGDRELSADHTAEGVADDRRGCGVDAGHRFGRELGGSLDPPILCHGDAGRSDAVSMIRQREQRAAVCMPGKSPSVKKDERLPLTGDPHVDGARAMTQSVPLNLRGHR